MLTYPNIDPVALSLGPIEAFGRTFGPLEVHWYGLMYLLGFVTAWLLGVYRARRADSPIRPSQMEDLVFYCAVGTVLGGRLGYVFFYNFDAFAHNPAIVFKIWEGGMSFHGGLLGVILAMFLFARKTGNPAAAIMDFSAPLIPPALGFGRIGNFIGGELWGRETDVAWAMVFPKGGEAARHPSQLYQACLEGLLLFVIVFWFSRKPRPRYTVASLFLICYGMFRFAVEFVREPDSHIGYAFGWMTRGQLLSVPMVLIGLAVFIIAHRHYAPIGAEGATEDEQKDKKLPSNNKRSKSA